MRFCPQCGQPAQDEHRFCMCCGQDVSAVPAIGPTGFPAPLFPPEPIKSKSSAKMGWIIVGAGLLILGIPILAIIAGNLAIAFPMMPGRPT